MNNVDRLNKSILGAIREYFGAKDATDTSKDNIINTLSNDELFDAWCNWEGLIRYASKLKSVVENIWDIKGGLK